MAGAFSAGRRRVILPKHSCERSIGFGWLTSRLRQDGEKTEGHHWEWDETQTPAEMAEAARIAQ